MKTIHKYSIDPRPGVQGVAVRKNAKLLKSAAQDNKVVFWYEIDTHEGWQEINFIVYQTGQEFDKEIHHRSNYVDTVQFDGPYVVHVYRIDQ